MTDDKKLTDDKVREILAGMKDKIRWEWVFDDDNKREEKDILRALAVREQALREIGRKPIRTVTYEQRRRTDITPQPIESVCEICREIKAIARRATGGE